MNRFTILTILCLFLIASLIQSTSCLKVPPPPSGNGDSFEEVPKGDLDKHEVDVSTRSVSKPIKNIIVTEKEETTVEGQSVVGIDDAENNSVKPATSTKTSLSTSNKVAYGRFYGWAIAYTRCWTLRSTVLHATYFTTHGYYCGSGRVYYTGRRICVQGGCRAYIYYWRA